MNGIRGLNGMQVSYHCWSRSSRSIHGGNSRDLLLGIG